MFSRRTPASLQPNRLTLALEARRAAGLPVIDLTVSNPTLVGLTYPTAEILAALSDPRSLTYEPTPQGLLETREAIARWHARQGYAADPASIVIAGSTSEAYGWLFRLLCNPGDSVLVPAPSYPLFECLAALDSVDVIEYRLDETLSWSIDFDSLASRLSPRVRAIVLVNPNNPTGSFLKPLDWTRLQSLAARHSLAVISDEVFFDYPLSPDPLRISSLAGPHEALTFTLSGLSKTAGLPQMKLGWIHVAGPAPLRREALDRLEWIADAYLPVSAPIQHAAPRWLELAPLIQSAILDRARSNLAALRSSLRPESGARVLPCQGGWSAVIEVPRIRSEEEWVIHLLDSAGILLQPGFFYDFPREAFLVSSLLANADLSAL